MAKRGKRPEGVAWTPPEKLTRAEEMICKRLKRVGRLFAFLRKHRRELFDDDFQAELGAMYSDMPRGTPPRPPAMLAMVTLLQAYERKSDAAAVEEVVFDRRWQMVLDCMGTEDPPFSQGVLVDFRRRLMEHGMDRRLLERTVELAKKTDDFGDRQLRVALDSSPLWGAGRVEDTFNLLGHALGVVVTCAASVLGVTDDELLAQVGLDLLRGTSLKAALDIDWDDDAEQRDALHRLLGDVQKLKDWLHDRLPHRVGEPPLKEALDLVERVIAQDLEPDPDGRGLRIKRGVSRDRRISVTDPDMRHGRKSKSRTINGFKRHAARDMDLHLTLAVCVRPANEPEHHALDTLRLDIERFGSVSELHIDRGYLAGEWTKQMFATGRRICAKPWQPRNAGRFPKTDFRIDLERKLVVCPERHVATIQDSLVARFDRETCMACDSRPRCTRSQRAGRAISIHPQEAMLIHLRELKASPQGREQLRQRVCIEHTLAHLSRRQGPRARYRTVRKNTLDLRRVAAVENLHVLDRTWAA